MDQTLDPASPFAHSRFDGRVALITGGTQGLGFATAALMKARGAAGLLLIGRDVDKGMAAADKLTADGCRARFVSADLATDAGVESVGQALDTEFDRVDAFINCAAATWRGTVWNTTADMWDAMLALNVKMPGLLLSECPGALPVRRFETCSRSTGQKRCLRSDARTDPSQHDQSGLDGHTCRASGAARLP